MLAPGGGTLGYAASWPAIWAASVVVPRFAAGTGSLLARGNEGCVMDGVTALHCDPGGRPDSALAHNARVLEVRLDDLDAVVISHLHADRRGPYCTGALTPSGARPVVTLPQAHLREISRCSVTYALIWGRSMT